MERPSEPGIISASFDSLTAAELASLRLSAQVMAHKADLANSQAARLFFESLEAAVMAEEAGRAQSSVPRYRPADDASMAGLLSLATNRSDRTVIAEYLGLLAANDRLPHAVRLFCRRLEQAVWTPREAQA